MDARQMKAGVGFQVTQDGILDTGSLQSRLNRLRAAGVKLNICPFGCGDDQLDENGYCRHLIGFTNSTDKEIKDGKGRYEPMVRRKGRYVVKVTRELIPRNTEDEEDGYQEYDEGPPQLEPILSTDQVRRITATSRVYRNVPKPELKPAKTPPEKK